MINGVKKIIKSIISNCANTNDRLIKANNIRIGDVYTYGRDLVQISDKTIESNGRVLVKVTFLKETRKTSYEIKVDQIDKSYSNEEVEYTIPKGYSTWIPSWLLDEI